jgi:hypothetical protein
MKTTSKKKKKEKRRPLKLMKMKMTSTKMKKNEDNLNKKMKTTWKKYALIGCDVIVNYPSFTLSSVQINLTFKHILFFQISKIDSPSYWHTLIETQQTINWSEFVDIACDDIESMVLLGYFSRFSYDISAPRTQTRL